MDLSSRFSSVSDSRLAKCEGPQLVASQPCEAVRKGIGDVKLHIGPISPPTPR